MFDPKSRFSFFSAANIAINLVIGIGAIILVERLIPAMGKILDENSVSLTLSFSMQEAILRNDSELFWQSITKAESHVTIDGEDDVLKRIEILGKNYWSGNYDDKDALLEAVSAYYNLNHSEMGKRESQARFLGLSGAWALGFLLIISIVLQLTIRSRLISELIDPVSELISVLRDYNSGNSLRRYHPRQAAEEIEEGGDLLNRLLDRDMSKL